MATGCHVSVGGRSLAWMMVCWESRLLVLCADGIRTRCPVLVLAWASAGERALVVDGADDGGRLARPDAANWQLGLQP